VHHELLGSHQQLPTRLLCSLLRSHDTTTNQFEPTNENLAGKTAFRHQLRLFNTGGDDIPVSQPRSSTAHRCRTLRQPTRGAQQMQKPTNRTSLSIEQADIHIKALMVFDTVGISWCLIGVAQFFST
jgi:hypothetical protein